MGVRILAGCSVTGGPRLKGQELGSHILTILKDPVVSNSMGLDYCKMLSKSVLSVPVHRNCIGQDMWQGEFNMLLPWVNPPTPP